MLQRSGGSHSLALLLLLSFHCPLFLQTDGADEPYLPEFVKYYLSCVEEYKKKEEICYENCDKNNTCETSRKFCKNICTRVAVEARQRCYDEAARMYLETNT